MASNYHIQKPYVLTSLPRSLDATGNRYAVGEVYGQQAGSKKRKRPEVAVGIDGEAANIYEISSSRLITSYPIPPQASFTCPPLSVRCRSTTSKDVARYTYISTQDMSRKITLFKDSVGASGATASTITSTNLGQSEPIAFMSTLSASGAQLGTAATLQSDLLAVRVDGGILCFDGETLDKRWQVAPQHLLQDLGVSRGALRIDLAQLALATDVVRGFSLSSDDVSSLFSQTIKVDSFNPDVLVLVTSTLTEQGVVRYLHALAISPDYMSQEAARQKLVSIHLAPLPVRYSKDGSQPLYRLDIPSGSLFELHGETVTSYDIGRSVPKAESSITVPGITSFLRLSKSSILTATPTSFDVYNPVFQSLQASVPLEFPEASKTQEGGGGDQTVCSFATHFAKLELAVAVVGANLVAVQLEPPKARSKKRRADGLLIDSIGRGISRPYSEKEKTIQPHTSSMFSVYLPGSVSGEYWSQYTADVKMADLLSTSDPDGFEDFLARKLGIDKIPSWRRQSPLAQGSKKQGAFTNGVHAKGIRENGVESMANGLGTPEEEDARVWTWTDSRKQYPQADRRWLMYAIGRIFGWQETPALGLAGSRLICRLPQNKIINYLVDAGQLSIPNLKSALKEHVRDLEGVESILGNELPKLLASIDPTMELLFHWLYATQLSTTELLSSVLLLMRSLELVRDTSTTKPKLLTDESPDDLDQGEVDQQLISEFPMELDRLDQELQVAEYFLRYEKDPRATALDAAVMKLGSCPKLATVQGLRRKFKTEEIRALIEVLRSQLVGQGWVTRYLDMAEEGQSEGDEQSEAGPETNHVEADAGEGEGEDLEKPFDSSIQVIADLLCRCIDAVRPGEWLIDDEYPVSSPGEQHVSRNPGDFLASFKWEVSAALEGAQEALYLRGIIGEAVRYGAGMQKYLSYEQGPVDAAREVARARPFEVKAMDTVESRMLPVGLKAPSFLPRHEGIDPTKVVSGGEVKKRSKREMGYLTSQKIGPYTLERIVI